MSEVKRVLLFPSLPSVVIMVSILSGCSLIEVPFYNSKQEIVELSMLSEAQQKHYELSMNYIDSAHYDIAEEKLLSIIDEYPQFADAYNALGVIYERRGRVTEGSEAFYTAIKINPNYVVAVENYSQLKCYTKGASSMEDDGNEAKELRLKSRLYTAASKCYISKNNFSDGEIMINKAIELDSDYALSYFYLATIQNKNQQFELAKQSIDQFNDLNGYTSESAKLGYTINRALNNQKEMQKYRYVLMTQFNEAI
ncbi:tetratricopeptide repeat protein [Ignatzschineria sp. LJL83]